MSTIDSTQSPFNFTSDSTTNKSTTTPFIFGSTSQTIKEPKEADETTEKDKDWNLVNDHKREKELRRLEKRRLEKARDGNDVDDSEDEDDEEGEGEGGIRIKPILPDFRFEEGVLLSIRPFIHRVSVPSTSTLPSTTTSLSLEDKPLTETFTAEGVLEGESNDLFAGPLRIEWGQLSYIIFRDQFIYPLIQGFVWGIGGVGLNALWKWNQIRLTKPIVSSNSKGSGGLLARLGIKL